MSRPLLRLRVLLPTSRSTPTVLAPIHHRSRHCYHKYDARPVSAAAAYYYTTSAPVEAEEAGAQPSGSRSQDAEGGADSADSAAAPQVVPDGLAEGGGAKGRTGGGEPLASSRNPPPRPKIFNASVSGRGDEGMTEEQKREVKEHNRDFEQKHGRAQPAAEDKVNKDFWEGGGKG